MHRTTVGPHPIWRTHCSKPMRERCARRRRSRGGRSVSPIAMDALPSPSASRSVGGRRGLVIRLKGRAFLRARSWAERRLMIAPKEAMHLLRPREAGWYPVTPCQSARNKATRQPQRLRDPAAQWPTRIGARRPPVMCTANLWETALLPAFSHMRPQARRSAESTLKQSSLPRRQGAWVGSTVPSFRKALPIHCRTSPSGSDAPMAM